MGISGTGSKPDLFPDKKAYVMQDEVASCSVNAGWCQFHSVTSASVEFKVTHHEDIFMM